MECPPSLSVASVQAILSSDHVLVPTLCEPAALKGLSEAVELIRGENTSIPIEVVRTRYKNRLVLTREAEPPVTPVAVVTNTEVVAKKVSAKTKKVT